MNIAVILLMEKFSWKNIQFTKIIKADGRLREFNFTRHNGHDLPVMFSINVTDNHFQRVYFEMLKENDSWKIQEQQIPAWVKENENNLHLVIEEELNHTHAVV